MHILVIDDEPAVRQVLAFSVTRAGHTVVQAAGVVEASAKLARGDFDVALCDIKMPDGSGLDLLRSARAASIDTTFVMVTAFTSIDTVVEALRAGAADYITKPVQHDELVHRLTQIESLRGLQEENRALRRAAHARAPRLYQFVSTSMQEVERLARKVAPTDGTVLITGESGTGKGVTARRIHELSKRSEAQFVQVNCGAIPEHLLESEFFGHTKGAFTGADHARKGLFTQADGGTLFLDEIGELPLQMQTKLLHVVEDKEVRPVGSEQARRVNVRIVAATNSDLALKVRDGKFREDLFFRLNMFQIHLPPLRERPDDIAPLIQFLLHEGEPGSGRAQDYRIDPAAEEVLLAHRWPGNVRELEHTVARARLLAEDQRITLSDLPSQLLEARTAPGPSAIPLSNEESLRDRMRRIEIEILQEAIRTAGGDRKLAAQRMGIGLSSLYRKLEEIDTRSSGEPADDKIGES